MSNIIEQETSELFGSLWHRLTDEQYRESVVLFTKRFQANGFDLGWFRGKKCLDAGCGSARYAVAMAMHGASEVVGCDISESGLATARQRTAQFDNIRFEQGSVLDLPFAEASFDFVCCAGVLHHTPSIEIGLDQITRVLRPGGKLFLLLYGSGGLRWKLIAALRPLARELGYDVVDAGIARVGLPENNRKHFLDDLFVPIQTLVKWDDLFVWLKERGYVDIERWTKSRLDHEASPASQIEDMAKLIRIFSVIEQIDLVDALVNASLGGIGRQVAYDFVERARQIAGNAAIAKSEIDRLIIGEGNHRLIATRSQIPSTNA